jgi:hypothetical protein
MKENGSNQRKISVTLPMREIHQLTPLSAKSISLDSPFKKSTYQDAYFCKKVK